VICSLNSIHKIGPIVGEGSTAGWKSGVRVLGIAESFKKTQSKSFVVGIVMRGDFRIDGFGFCRPTVGGNDSTESLVRLFKRLKRQDIRAWMLGGSLISWFNAVDIVELHRITGVPVVCVTYHPSEGVEKYLKEYFPDNWQSRLETLEKAGIRTSINLRTGHSAFITTAGVGIPKAKQLLDIFTLDGRIPEPIRVSRLIAAALYRDSQSYDTDELVKVES
jgi:endonuclease V-like protein UPF0215 family